MEKWFESLMWYAKFARNVAIIFGVAVFLFEVHAVWRCFAWPFMQDAYLTCAYAHKGVMWLPQLIAVAGTALFATCAVIVGVAAGCLFAAVQLSGKK